MLALVTGGKGFIGSHLVEKLEQLDHDVEVVDLKDGKSYLQWAIDRPKRKYDVVFHLAAYTEVLASFEEPFDFWKNNALENWVIPAVIEDETRIVFASTCAVYGNKYPNIDPQSPYARSKYASEGILSDLHKNTVILRFFNVYGPGMKESKYKNVMKAFVDAKENGKEMVIHNDGHYVRDYVHVSDVVEALLNAVGADIGTYDVCTGVGTSVMDVASKFGGPIRYEKVDYPQPDSIIGDAKRSIPGWQPIIDINKGIETIWTRS